MLELPVYKTRAEINAVPIVENYDPIVVFTETEKLVVNKNPKTLLRKSSFDALVEHKTRKTVYEKLVQASEQLPEGYQLLILESFRPYDVQLTRFDAKFKKLRDEINASIPDEEVKRRTRMSVADPRAGAPHQTGGAIDLTIIDANGVPLDMGTDWAEFNEKSPTKNWHRVTRAQMKNRMMLHDAMVSAGFINYPGEWWHFCYGDRMWAAYSNAPHAIYGSAELS